MSQSDAHIRIAHAPVHKTQSLFTNMKAKIEIPTTGAVYRLNCTAPDCKAVYIGETGREVTTRIREHMNDLRHEQTEMKKYQDHLTALHLPNLTNVITRSQQKIVNQIQDEINNVRLTANYKTAALEHQMTMDHKFDYEDVDILTRERWPHRRKRLEALHIVDNPTSINFKRDTQYVDAQTMTIIRTAKHLRQRAE